MGLDARRTGRHAATAAGSSDPASNGAAPSAIAGHFHRPKPYRRAGRRAQLARSSPSAGIPETAKSVGGIHLVAAQGRTPATVCAVVTIGARDQAVWTNRLQLSPE